MKESGINYYVGELGLDTGSFAVLYTFENNAGSTVSSVSLGQSEYNGTLSSVGSFWSVPNSGYFNGNTLAVNNASGLFSTSWTKIFAYEKVNTDEFTLFNSLGGGSGYKIGVTPSNKPYFESINSQPVVAAANVNLSSKNLLSFSYVPNFMSIGYYNWTSKSMETESFSYPFNVARSDNWRLGGGTGYMDYFIYDAEYLSSDVISQLASGFWARPTGLGYDTQTVCTTGITGYQDAFIGTTGITGQVVTPGGDEGRDFYTGAFPTFHSTLYLTGYISSGLYSSGVEGVTCQVITGDSFPLFEYQTGYAASYGMQKVQLFPFVENTDIVKSSWELAPFNDIYNKVGFRNYSGYQFPVVAPTGQINLYYNGLAQANEGWTITGNYLIVSGATVLDSAFLDLKSGDKKMLPIVSTGYAFAYTGQEIYLNGLNLVSGYDFVAAGGGINLTNRNTGVVGYIFEYPIVLVPRTGNSSLVTGQNFWRNSSNIYQNGLRQLIRQDYIEGATFDLLSGNSFNGLDIVSIYGDSDLYWD